ncbi:MULTISPECIES: hypothetical protein [unclassified Lysobacter]|uniref:hypothetical protein n=1 Tax=unclassified Lysobacter TaxID=2635362 RepID=UPI001BE83613|nr:MULTISPECIES: hypothetical protein [unclassified Lysobacter]MBT2745790.1 hypothetical protein [Lysobacter sp. ISL-42]MBT2749651.1 hypothetical protein [Lysobacter sp. ISL-50]MBT2777630.1 hypothetical protein [Lysobacter sp. ISL-54]MBT2782118.1 hypothetical protein [Lysobacter sp. ISL-52]
MQTKRSLSIAVAVLAAVVGAYFLGRADAPQTRAAMHVKLADAATAQGMDDEAALGSSPLASKRGLLPPPDTPLKNSFAELRARAAGGDADAAKRLLRDLDRCSRLRSSQWKSEGATNDLTRKSTDGMSAAQLRTYQLQLDAMELRQQGVRKNQALCAGVGDKMLDALVPSIAQAARLGDEQARACYLDRGPLYDARSLIKHPESLRNYGNAASALIDSGLAAGDWRVVDLLQQAYEPGAQSLLAGLIGADPVQHYRYLKLYRLGAESHRVAQLDRQLDAIASSLSPGQLVEANEWAQTTLRQNFKDSSTQTTPPGWDSCEF